MGLATIAPLIVAAAIGLGAMGLIAVETMIDVALAAGENPGMVTFGAMFLATPVQWLTGHSQVRVRKYLAIMFFLLALSNFVMFLIPSGLLAAFGEPFLIAGTVALALALPLFLTSSRWAQRTMGMRRWRLLHKLTYVVALALLAHVVLLGEIGPGSLLIALGFAARTPAIRHKLERKANRPKLTRTGLLRTSTKSRMPPATRGLWRTPGLRRNELG